MAELLKKSLDTFYQPRHDELVAIVKSLGVFGDVDGVLTPLTGGHHNHVYQYKTPLGAIVVKHPKDEDGVVALKTEFDLLHKLDGRRMPRAIEHTDIKGTSVALIEFISGDHKGFNELTIQEVEELARAMVDLHGITADSFSHQAGTEPTERGMQADYVRAMIRESVTQHLQLLQSEGCDLSAYDEAQQTITAGTQRLEDILIRHAEDFSGTSFSLLHHDLNSGNVIWGEDGSVTFIDPNPTYGDPLDDVMCAIVDNQGSPAFRQALLDAYVRISGRSEISAAQQEVYTLKNWLDDLVWTIDMCEKYKGSSHQEKYEKMHVLRLETLQAFILQEKE